MVSAPTLLVSLFVLAGALPGHDSDGGDVASSINITVVTYNTRGWRRQEKEIALSIDASGAFDLMGFQECDNISNILVHMQNKEDFSTKQGPVDLGIAWNKNKFDLVEMGEHEVGMDGFGKHYMSWVRLMIKGSKKNVIFANTRGAIGKCNKSQWSPDSMVGDIYVRQLKKLVGRDDSMFFTGDFNCQTYDDVIKMVSKEYTDACQGTFFFPILYQPDHIFASRDVEVKSWANMWCPVPGHCLRSPSSGSLVPEYRASPSDHQLVWGDFAVATGSSHASGFQLSI